MLRPTSDWRIPNYVDETKQGLNFLTRGRKMHNVVLSLGFPCLLTRSLAVTLLFGQVISLLPIRYLQKSFLTGCK